MKSKVVNFKDNLLELDSTIFYPGGGGQPHDTGKIFSDNFEGEVVEVFRENDKIIHKINPVKGELKQGDAVVLELNQQRRDKLVRMHTGEHILFKSLEKVLGKISLVKINLGENESSLFIDAKDVTWDKLFEAEKLTNEIIQKNSKVIEKKLSKKDAIELGKLRIKPERIKSEKVRVIEVEGFDWSACTGTHAENTGFVGNLLITKFNVVKGNYELRFKTDVKEEFFKLTKTTRKLATLLETDYEHIISAIEKLQQDVEDYKEKFREISAKLLDHNNVEEINGIIFISNIVEGVEKKQLTDKANELIKEKTIVCFITKNERATVLLSISKDLDIDAPELLNNVLEKFNGKGGGRDKFAMGSCELEFADKIIGEIKKYI